MNNILYYEIGLRRVMELFFLVLIAIILSSSPVKAEYVEEKNLLPGLTLVDIHSHFYRGEGDLDELLSFMDRNNVYVTALSGLSGDDADKHVREAARKKPERFIAFLRSFDPAWEHSKDYVLNLLSTGEYNGIGEIFINGHGRRIQGDNPVLMGIYGIAAQFQVPVLVHWTIGSVSEREPGTKAGFQQLKKALAANPGTTFILAHCGKGPPPFREDFEKILDYLLNRYKNLFLDLSGLHRELFSDDGSLCWFGDMLFRLIAKYPGRFVLGFDLGDPGTLYSHADGTVRLWRKFLSLFPADIAVKVGRENALSILGPGQLASIEARKKKRFSIPEKQPEPQSLFFDPE